MNNIDEKNKSSLRYPVVAGMLVLTAVLTALLTLFVVRFWILQPGIEPVVLDHREKAELEEKLKVIRKGPGEDELKPEPYREYHEDRVIYLTQRELNAMISRNQDLAERIALHLSRDMISATALITLPPEMPVLSGKTVEVRIGLRMGYSDGSPVMIVEGISLMGVPLPSAWMGNIKGRDLFIMYGDKGGFWQVFGEGIQDLRVEDGRLRVQLSH